MKTIKQQLSAPASVIFIAFFFFLAGCKKHTCQCTAHNVNTPDPGGHSDFTVKGGKTKAKYDCENHASSVDQAGNFTSCELK
jgi:hypothetical protein